MPMWKPSCCKLSILFLSIIVHDISARIQGDPANEIAGLINDNRTASNLTKLYASPGLGCMALQYISGCSGNCSSNNTLNCKFEEVDITEIYAPNCGVELPTVDTISGHLAGCRWMYLDPDRVVSEVLVSEKGSLSLLRGKEHTEVGVGFIRANHGAFIWCALFANGRADSTFVLQGGKGIEQREGCFSGTDVPCSGGRRFLQCVLGNGTLACHLISLQRGHEGLDNLDNLRKLAE